ncbi:MAG: helix-turn-helix domain-containing protein [Lamprobacter sp.]|uniref:helix-turn-helix domain-containing protein n=1 Tax=Lamprobacter sp. TaxID=3100796 RepID=UPI002B25F878|nr:helix-turn-helix domain-containing protein [Lamprobacter sp.]MEA3641859.1 helix-turn-helix domain-containing protein [Lamprobacter sp.]
MKTIPALESVNGTELAKALGVSKQAVSHWRTGRYRVPAEHCREIERLTNGAVTVYELRPDVFGPAPSGETAA